MRLLSCERMRVVLQMFRFLSLVLGGLVLSLTAPHVIEMPAKLALPPRDYLLVQRIYPAFSAVSAVLEPAAVVAVLVLTLLVRRSRALRPALVAALCFVAALLILVAVVIPVDVQWRPGGSLDAPDNFDSLRMRWELGQALRAALALAGFVSLVIAVLTDLSTTAAAAVKLTVPEATRTNATVARAETADQNAADVIVPPDKNAVPPDKNAAA